MKMQLFVLFSVICLSLSAELDSYEEYLSFAAKNHFKSVADYTKTVGLTVLDIKWEEFKVKFNRKYNNEEEEQRKQNFLKSLKFVESQNTLFESGDDSQKVDINQFADWRKDEYNSMLTANLVSFDSTLIIEDSEPHINITVPASFDWRQHNKVTPIKDQGQCGSCWAFATIATIESAFLIKQNKSLNLSEQQLVDCCNDGNKNWCFGCGGGLIQEAFKYIANFGIQFGTDYKYVGHNQKCGNSADKEHMKIKGFKQLAHPSTDDEIMHAIFTNGPVAVFIDADGDDFKFHRSGVMKLQGSHSADHYVTAVGWTSDYWIIKNSWGTHWGENGFGKMAKRMNLRGFNNYVFYPIV